jgi:hypothetical protein
LPDAEEKTYAATLINTAGDKRREAIEDLLWAIVNSPEFTIQN